MPEDYELYYGFTRFAMELNELDLETAKILPKTDTRFRPDQRYQCILKKVNFLMYYYFLLMSIGKLFIYFINKGYWRKEI